MASSQETPSPIDNSSEVTSLQLASWQTIPNEMYAYIFQFLDIQSCTKLRGCSRREQDLVNELVRKEPAEISFRCDSNGNVHLKLFRKKYRLLIQYVIQPIGDDKCSVSRRCYDFNCNPDASYWINWQPPRRSTWVDSDKTYNEYFLEVAYRIFGQILSEPIFNVLTLDFEVSNDFEIDPNFIGKQPKPVEVLRFINCMNENTIDNILMNFNIQFKSIEKIYSPRNVHLENVIDNSVEQRNRFIELIGVIESCYVNALPEDYKVQSYEDGLSRLRQFASEFLKTLEDIEKDVFQNQEHHADALMYLRAAYSRDPVEYLQSTRANYHEKIQLFRGGIGSLPIRSSILALLSIVYVTKIAGLNESAQTSSAGLFKSQLSSDNCFENYSTFMEAIEKLCEF